MNKPIDMKQLISRYREIPLVLLIITLFLIINIRTPGFISPSNIYKILDDTCILMIIGMAQLLVLLIGGIDLSIGSTMALSGMSVAMLNQYNPDIPILALVAITLLIGAVLGAFNGVLVAYGNIPAIITTLGTINIYRGFTFLLSGGQWVGAHEMTDGFMAIPNTPFLGISSMIWVTVIVIVFLFLFTNYSVRGREIYALGNNETASIFAGIKTKKVKLTSFILSGVLASLAGLLYVTNYASAQNDTATTFELQAVAACVIGGVSITGGIGTVPGVVLGAFFIGIVNNALPVIDLSPFYQMAIHGFVILLAIVSNTLMDRRTERLILQKRSL